MFQSGMSNKRGRPVGSFWGKYPTSISGKRTRAWLKWTSMISRCYRSSHPAFKYYGSRGIKVCARWHGRQGFDNFVDDLGMPPDGLTLERINNAGDYEPGNCRWATWKEQAANRRRVGPTPNPNSLSQKAIAVGLSYSVVYQRVKLLGWPEEKALTTPKGAWFWNK